MADVILAPTGGLYRDPAQKEINDQIIDQDGAVFLKEKTTRVIPRSSNRPGVQTILKRYHNVKVINQINERTIEKIERLEEEDKRLEYHPQTNVSLPDMQEDNNKYLRGSNDWD